MHQNINHLTHEWIRRHIQPDHICLDATCGNGHDTLFLAQLAQYVHAIDIQDDAISATQERLKQAGVVNVKLHHASHDQLIRLFPPEQRFDIVMYNLGYLPHSDHAIITSSDTTVSSLRQVLPMLRQGGLLTLTIYTGHEGGYEEAVAVEEYLTTLDKHDYTILRTSYLNRNNSPYLIAVEKIR